MIPRKRFISSLVWSLVGFAVPVQAQTPQFKNALQELYTLADSHNATLRSLQSAVVEAEAGVQSAEAAKLPDVSGQVSFSYLGNARLWNRHFGESTSAPMPHFGNNYMLRAQQVVYSGGALTAGVELAGQNARMAGLSAAEGHPRGAARQSRTDIGGDSGQRRPLGCGQLSRNAVAAHRPPVPRSPWRSMPCPT